MQHKPPTSGQSSALFDGLQVEKPMRSSYDEDEDADNKPSTSATGPYGGRKLTGGSSNSSSSKAALLGIQSNKKRVSDDGSDLSLMDAELVRKCAIVKYAGGPAVGFHAPSFDISRMALSVKMALPASCCRFPISLSLDIQSESDKREQDETHNMFSLFAICCRIRKTRPTLQAPRVVQRTRSQLVHSPSSALKRHRGILSARMIDPLVISCSE